MQFPDGNYSPEQFQILQAAMDLSCEELGIADTDTASRERIAIALLSLSSVGQKSVDRLSVYAVSQYRMHARA